jgi:hypothetical protein
MYWTNSTRGNVHSDLKSTATFRPNSDQEASRKWRAESRLRLSVLQLQSAIYPFGGIGVLNILRRPLAPIRREIPSRHSAENHVFFGLVSKNAHL